MNYKKMNYEKPAEGILKTNDWGDSKAYKVSCSCGADGHDHDVWVESDEHHVTVTIYTKVKSNWRVNRFRQIWNLLTKGYLEHSVDIALTEQQAFNYAYTLHEAVKDVEQFKKEASNKS
jgi:hypothetical protein